MTDVAMARQLARSQILRNEEGGAPATTGGRRIALYQHYSKSGRISQVVRRQLAGYRALGFDVVLTTNTERLEDASWRAAAAHCWRLVRRRNIGFDFGAWRDVAAMLLAGKAPPEELLLVNDSVLGPIRPLEPPFVCARRMGTGAVGMTESRQGGVHLQSYFMLVLGAAATADTLEFLVRLRLSTAKWLIVQRGEFGLTRYLVRRGHRVAALFGYARALDAILACADERQYLATVIPELAQDIGTPASLRRTSLRWPLNPTIHLWRGLPRCLGFPFVKVQLLRRNSGLLPDAAEWSVLVKDDSIGFSELVSDHLATLESVRKHR